MAQAAGKPDPIMIAESAGLAWPPNGRAAVQALADAPQALEAALLAVGWQPLERGGAWYAKRFAWVPVVAPRRVEPAQAAGQSLRRPRSVSRHAVPAGVPAVLISGGAVTACEILLAAGHVLAAEIGFAVLVLVLVNARVSRSSRSADATAALNALAIVALARVVAIAAPLPDASGTVHLLFVALSTGFAVWRLAPPVGAPIRDLVAWRPRTGGGYVLGACVGLGVVLYSMGAPALVGPDATVGDVALALVAVAIAATVEEVLFRGILQSTLERLLGRAGVLVASALFASLYLSAGSLAVFLTMALAGLVFAASVVRARGLGAAVVGHILLAGGAAVVWPAVFGAPHAVLPGGATAPVLALAVTVGASLVFVMRPSAVAV